MKKNTFFIAIVITGFTIASCDQKLNIKNGDLEILVNEKMQMKLQNLKQADQPLMSDFTYSEYLQTRYFTAKDFRLSGSEKRDVKTPSGDGTQWILKGKYKDYPLEKIVTITTYQKFPNSAYFLVSYINNGDKELPIVEWVNNHYTILPSKSDTTKFWSFQGSSHADRRDWIQKVNAGVYHDNYMGMNATDYGGGIPVVDLWRNNAGGIMIGSTESIPRLISLPVRYDKYADGADISVSYGFTDNPTILNPGDTLDTYGTFAGVHEGDCFPALQNYAAYMETRGIVPPEPEEGAFEPMWCAWGYERGFTLKEILNTLPKVKDLGIKWVGLDDGFSQSYGDWHTNKEKFPGGDAEMKSFVERIHAQGLKAMLWWNPIAVSLNSNFLHENPRILLKKEDGAPQYITWWDAFQLSPTDSIAKETTKKTVELFIRDWGYDGLKLDGQNLNMVYADYARRHGINNPNQSYELLPQYYKDIIVEARNINPNAAVEFCPCGEVINYYIMPYTNQFVSSDPKNSWQVRTRAMVYHALMPNTAYYGDHVELINDDFASQIGVGAVPGTKFVWPEVGTARGTRLLLTPEKESLFKKWIGLYNAMELSKGKYMGNLYDIGYDYPETHCIEKDGGMYYAFYNKDFNGKIQLRGLNSEKKYAVEDYFNNISLGSVPGNNPELDVNFKDFLMLKVVPE